MKLQCQVEVVNRLHISLNVRSSGKYLKSTLALGKEPKSETEYFILHFSSLNKTGTKYRVKNIKQVFVKCLNEGKATLRFEDPQHDLCIKSEAIQLKCFMRTLKSCITGDTKSVQLAPLSSLSITPKDIAPTKLFIRDRSEFPVKGLPRTLESLYIKGLGLCNFRRDILLLKQLVVLDLSDNVIERIPPEFGRMPNLRELYLSNNQLGVRGEIDWRWLMGPQITQKLKLLNLSGNKLGHIPKSIWKLQNLVTLTLDNNLLDTIPTSIGRMSNLRYLTLTQNDLTLLPCGLLQCRLDYIDVSENKFDTQVTGPESVNHTPWEFCIGNLVNLAAKVVLKYKMYYAPNIIPRTLVEFLDNANMCICGAPVVNSKFYMCKELELKTYFPVVVFNNNSQKRTIPFQCYFCSFKCYNR